MPLDQLQLLNSAGGSILLDEYQAFTKTSDQSGLSGAEGLGFVLLGLFGEVGSLLSALKKKKRDKDAYIAYEASVLEEFGDALWYLANAASRIGLKFSDLAERLEYESDDEARRSTASFINFSQLQKKGGIEALASTNFERRLLELAARTGALLDCFERDGIAGQGDRLRTELIEVFRALIKAADDADIRLDDAALQNVAKSEGRWPQEKNWGIEFDAQFPQQERFPRRMSFDFFERNSGGGNFVILEMNGVNVGDTLTDNRQIEDDYRFHDVFHLAHAAVLGWSPTLRSLLKRKRKSVPKIDQNEDGARAILIEEGISSWVFNHALQANFFGATRSLDFALLKSVREFVRGYEVEVRPYWQWEIAIIEGYRVFRLLKEYRGGRVMVNLDDHELVFEAHSNNNPG